MANWFVYSGASGTTSGADWANAKLNLASAASASAAGDNIFVANDHVENTSSTISISIPGSIATPSLVMSVNRQANAIPVGSDYMPGAFILSNFNQVNIDGSFYMMGLTLGHSGTMVMSTQANRRQYYKDCIFWTWYPESGDHIVLNSSGSNGGVEILWDNCSVRFTTTTGYIQLNEAYFQWFGANSKINQDNAGLIPSTLFKYATAANIQEATFTGIDLSMITAGKFIVDVSALSSPFVMRRCKLSSNGSIFTGSFTGATPSVILENCDSGNTTYRNEFHNNYGDLTTEITNTLSTASGGANNGVQKYSWKVVTTSNATKLHPFGTPLFGYREVTTGSAITKNVEVISSNTCNNDQIWSSIEFQGDANFPDSIRVDNGMSNPLSTNVAQPTSSVTWDNSPSTPVKHNLLNTFIPQLQGAVYGRVYVGRPNFTVYINPRLT